VPFFYSAAKVRWSAKLAVVAAWLVVLYPEGIFYTVAHMREPILIGMAMILFWGVARWFETSGNLRTRWKVISLCMLAGLFMLFISWRTGAGILLMLVVWFWVEHIHPSDRPKNQAQTLADRRGSCDVWCCGWISDFERMAALFHLVGYALDDLDFRLVGEID